MCTVSVPQYESGDEVTLSTGETLEFPIHTDSSIGAIILSADRDQTDELLPDGLSPVRAGRDSAAVWLMSAQHRNVGDGELDEYNEFAVMISVTPGSPDGVPYVSPLLRTETYVWYMPVTTEPARAFGDELWGYPKVVGDIEIEDDASTRHTAVTVDGEHLITFEMKKPRTLSQEDVLTTYTVQNDSLLQITADVSGRMGIWPYSNKFSFTLGNHPKATILGELGFGGRAFGRFYGEGELEFPPGTPIDTH